MQSKGQGEQREHRCRPTKTRSSRHRYYHCYALGFALTCFVLAAAAAVPRAEGQQMDPAAMQRQIQQQMGGSPGGGGAPPPNRIGENGDASLCTNPETVGCLFNIAAGLDVRARTKVAFISLAASLRQTRVNGREVHRWIHGTFYYRVQVA